MDMIFVNRSLRQQPLTCSYKFAIDIAFKSIFKWGLLQDKYSRSLCLVISMFLYKTFQLQKKKEIDGWCYEPQFGQSFESLTE